MFIRQLGLKAYVDFPGAIHTRYSHGLGVMHLAGKMGELLEKKGSGEASSVAQNLKDNRGELMAAGFLHDIGHGPFSHAVDFCLKIISGKRHEDVTGEIIDRDLGLLENYGITSSAVKKIIVGDHPFPFVSDIVNGPLDVDKLDYLMRDAHNVGLRYSLDVDHFANSYTVLGDYTDLGKCQLGLDDSQEAIVTAEIFVLIWKSMYDLVYHIEQSRIAEKMLEKAILKGKDENGEIRDYFTDIAKFIELNDDGLLGLLEKSGPFPKEVVKGIREKKLYSKRLGLMLEQTRVTMSEKFLARLSGDESVLSEELCTRLSSELGVDPYQVIADIVKSRVPESIHLDEMDKNGEPIELRAKSDIIPHIQQKSQLRVYAHASLAKTLDEDRLRPKIEQIISGW